MGNEASNSNRHQLDLYLSYGARSCVDRELGVSSLDRHKNAFRTISISPVGADLSWRPHPSKIPSAFLVPCFSSLVFLVIVGFWVFPNTKGQYHSTTINPKYGSISLLDHLYSSKKSRSKMDQSTSEESVNPFLN